MNRIATAAALASLGLVAGAALPACLLDYSPGAVVDLYVEPDLGEATDANGARLQIDAAWVHLGSLTLTPCDGAEARVPEGWLSWARPVAHAHHARGDGLGLDGGHVVSLAEETWLGTLRPPPARYCGVEVIVEAATSTSDGEREALGEVDTLRVEGRREGVAWTARGPGGAALALPLTWTATADDPAARLAIHLDLRGAIERVDTAVDDEIDRGLDLVSALDADVSLE
ncbi:MAG: hypothetical protein H6719_15535 [Sandaracinaceae bacterium]|nr:hypothetical protein [Sandaracinaceae bacterium]